MSAWTWVAWGVGIAFLVGGLVLAMATTTANRMRWAVLAPLVWGTGTLLMAVLSSDWGPIAVTAGMYSYAAINYWNIRRTSA